jgi:hypothetical protein
VTVYVDETGSGIRRGINLTAAADGNVGSRCRFAAIKVSCSTGALRVQGRIALAAGDHPLSSRESRISVRFVGANRRI